MVVLLHSAPAFGAVERYVVAIAGALGRDALLVHPGIEQFERLGIRTVVVERPTVRTLAGLLRRERAEIAHVTDVWPQAVAAARLARVPRVLVTHHTPELPRRDNLPGRAWQQLGWALKPEVIYTSEADRSTDGRRPSHVIPLGIDVERFGAAVPALGGDAPIVGTVGRLEPQKDQATFIDAVPAVVARRQDVRFVIAGEGTLKPQLAARARGYPVELLGHRDDVPEVLTSLAVFVSTSRFEGLGVAVLEAQAAGVPVVATPVGGVAETVIDGETGLVVRPGDPDALAQRIIELLEDSALAHRLTTEARRRVRERYTESRMIEETLALYGWT